MVILRVWACLFWLFVFSFPALAQDPPQRPMETHNLKAAQNVVNALGYEVIVKVGVIIGPQEETDKGTAVCVFYAEDKDGDWYRFDLKLKDSKVVEFKGESVETPQEEDKCLIFCCPQ